MNNAHSYTGTAKFLHWLMAAIWLFAWFSGMAAVYLRDQINPNHGLTIWHKAVAITLVLLIVIRVAWRLTHPAPALPASMSPLMQKAAKWGHLLIYLVALIAMPLSGWMWSSIADKPVTFLNLFTVPPLVAPNPDFYDLAKGVHVALAWFCGALIGGHILLAFKHKWIDKDGVMEGMLPQRR